MPIPVLNTTDKINSRFLSDPVNKTMQNKSRFKKLNKVKVLCRIISLVVLLAEVVVTLTSPFERWATT
jgi:hypothetical protein